MDVEIYELTAGGTLEPRADFTIGAKEQVEAALTAELQRRNTAIVQYRPPTADPVKSHTHDQLIKLHDVVGGVIIPQVAGPAAFKFPTKSDRFDWGLGPEVGVLREDHDADFGLFVIFRDAHSSPGRVGLIVMGSLLGVPMTQGRQTGIASLVDLRTGDIVWFNVFSDPSGDLRTRDVATTAVKKLLEGWPL
jgi:hypothetical protein